MEIDADDAEPIHITGEGGDDLKCHMTILTTSYDNHTILDRPPDVIYDLIHNHMTWLMIIGTGSK